MNREKIIQGLKWCIRADKQCVYALVDCPYVEQCKTNGRTALKQEALDFIENTPPNGEWLFDRPEHWKCSNCGYVEGRIALSALRNYCPVCGAHLRSE